MLASDFHLFKRAMCPRKSTENAKGPNLACQQKPALDRQGRQARLGPFPNSTGQLSNWVRTLQFIREFKWFLKTWTLVSQHVDEALSIVCLDSKATLTCLSHNVNSD